MRPLLVLFVLLAGCGREAEQAAPAAKASPVEPGVVRLAADSPQLARIHTAPVTVERVALEEVVAPGKIEANPNRISHVVMPVAGRVRQVMAGVGDAVREGDLLLVIESPDAGAAASAYQQARARVTEARATLAKAESDLSRVKDLFEGRAVAQKEVLAAEAAVAQARSASEQAQAAQGESLRRLQIFGLDPANPVPLLQVRAPLSGKVLDLSVAAGEYRNDTSAPLMTIADLSSVLMAADVPENQIRLVQRGEKTRITLSAFPGEVLWGTVARIADVVDPQTRTIKVRAALANPQGRFRPEMFGEIRHEEMFRDVAVVPAAAVVQTDQSAVLYRERSTGVFEAVPVELGKQLNGRVPVLKGVAAGDKIVVDGAMLLKGMQ